MFGLRDAHRRSPRAVTIEARILAGLAVALAVAYWATPVAIRLAARLEFYDHPIGYKGHERPTPYLGGAAVVTGFLAAVLLLAADWERTLPVCAGVVVLWAVGTVDDRRTVSPVMRVGLEVAIGAGLWALGLGWQLGIGDVADLAVTAFWVVAVVNAFNLFDNMDGAAGSMAGVVAAGLAALGVVQGDAWLATAGAALAGACLGFLPHNLLASPAKIFLGDGGSMPIGFAVAALTMVGMSDAAPAWQSLGMGLLFVGVPALDTALVVVSRRRRGISILTAGRDHLTHRTRSRLQTARAVALALGATQAVISVLAVVALQGGSLLIAGSVGLYLVGIGVAIAVLDTRVAPDTPVATSAGAGAPSRPGRRALAAEAWSAALLVPVGVLAGLSPFASGYYAPTVWAPGAIAVVVAVTALAIGRPVRLGRPAAAALGALGLLGLWALASTAWADSSHQATIEANRLLGYGALLGLLLLAVRSERAGSWLLGAGAATAVAVAAVVLGRMLGGDPGSVFLGGRLDQPLGYINGQAAFFLLAAWPCLALAEQRRAWRAGVGAAAVTLLGCMLVLSQSRGVALAALGSVAVVLAIVPGRTRRAWLLVVLAAALAPALGPLTEIFRTGQDGTLGPATATHAASVTLIVAAAAGIVWAGLTAAAAALAGRDLARNAARAGMVAVVLAALGTAAVQAGPIARTLDRQYTAFVHLGVEPQGSAASSSRLASGAGNRYDYWRVAWSAFAEKPVAGWGAGGYEVPYFQRRATTEDVRQPHSVELQVLSELGLVGGLLLAVLVAAVAFGGWRIARAGRADPRARTAAVATIGLCTAWLLHSSVDWIHLLPGVTALAVAAAAVLLRDRSTAGTHAAAATTAAVRRPRPAAALAVGVVLLIAGMSLTREVLADHFRASAQSALARDPVTALREVDRSLRLDAESVDSYHVKAAALARFGEAGPARAALLEATRRAPADFVTWALLGDLAVRTGDLSEAARDYGRASRLNPRDPGLRALSRDPAAAAGGAG
jgi:UDP-GlcNAc:undecaprenyl-phosphate GlcNAc-1-phosphate transferase